MCIFTGLYERSHNAKVLKCILRLIANVFCLSLKITCYYTLAYLWNATPREQQVGNLIAALSKTVRKSFLGNNALSIFRQNVR